MSLTRHFETYGEQMDIPLEIQIPFKIFFTTCTIYLVGVFRILRMRTGAFTSHTTTANNIVPFTRTTILALLASATVDRV